MVEKTRLYLTGLLNKVLEWRERHISNKNFIILASILVGILAGLAAVLLKSIVHYIQELLSEQEDVMFHNYMYLIYPLIGILLTVFYVQFFRNGQLGRGIGNILYSISRRGANVERDKTYSHIISSALTVGFGGSAGLESPIVVTGSAIGANTGRVLRLNYKERTLLLACGASAGIAAVFNSPIAGVLFALEVLLAEFTIPYFIPLLIATATASLISNMLYSGQLFFLITSGWDINAIPFYVALGVICGLTSVYMTRTILWVEGGLNKWNNIWLKAISGGVLLGILIFFLPPLYGEGYTTVEQLLQGAISKVFNNSLFYGYSGNPWVVLAVFGTIIPVKIIATSITTGSGGNGGVFAPSLFTGAFVGFFFVFLLNTLGLMELNMANFIVVGMAGVLSGVNHAPLTAIFLIAEITGGYILFVPLMIVSAFSYFIARYFEPYTVYTKKLAERGDLIAHDKDKVVLNQMRLKNLLETDFIPVKKDDSLGELIDVVAHSKRNIFPVLDNDNRLLGLITLDTIREVMFKSDLYDTVHVKDLMFPPQTVILADEEMVEVMKKFERYNAWNLPVIEEGKYIGFVSKSHIFTRYRGMLIEQTEALSHL